MAVGAGRQRYLQRVASICQIVSVWTIFGDHVACGAVGYAVTIAMHMHVVN